LGIEWNVSNDNQNLNNKDCNYSIIQKLAKSENENIKLLKELTEKNGELSKLLLDYKKVQAELIQVSETQSTKVVQ